jgi:hypothetical protein
MRENQKIVIDLGSVCLELSFEDGDVSKGIEILPTSRPVVRSSFAFGVMNYSRRDLEKYKARNERVKVNVIGGFRLDSDIPPALALDVMDSIRVIGVFQAMDHVKNALMQSGKIQ